MENVLHDNREALIAGSNTPNINAMLIFGIFAWAFRGSRSVKTIFAVEKV